MSRDKNEFNFTGRMVSDPETRNVGESTITTWRVAIDNSYKGKDGQWVDKALFIEVSAWNGLGQSVAAVCKKGNFVDMRVAMDEDIWDDKETGTKRRQFKFKLINSYDWRKYDLVKKNSGEESQAQNRPEGKKKGRPKKSEAVMDNSSDILGKGPEEVDEDIPF